MVVERVQPFDAPVQTLDITDEEIANKLAVAEPVPGCKKYHTYEYVGYSDKAAGYHEWACSKCGDASITICAVRLGRHETCIVCNAVGYEFA